MKIQLDFEGKTTLFNEPIKVFSTKTIKEIQPYLDEIMKWVNEGYYAAGYLSYESAEAFNSFNLTKSTEKCKLPLLLFGIFKNCTQTKTKKISNYKAEPLNLISNTSQKKYSQNIDYIRQQIEFGNTYQTNYTIQLKSDFTVDPFEYYQFLQQNHRAKYSAYIEHQDLSVISISPELFFKIDEKTITTKPMKGTSARGVNLSDDQIQLKKLFNEKNKAENMMIVDLLRNDLSRISKTGTVNVTNLFCAEKYPTVWQMTSTIKSQLKDSVSFFEILQSIFPCGSITGAPKSSTMKIIAEIEEDPREIYCGTIGFIAPHLNKAIFNIPIRTLQINKKQASYGVGGGITWDSTDQDEYNEIIEKTQILNPQNTLPEYLLESILLENHNYFLLDEHLNRLRDSAIYFDFLCDIDEIKNQLLHSDHLKSNKKQKVRICLQENGSFIIEFNEILSDMIIDSLKMKLLPIKSQNIYLYHKTSNRKHFPTLKKNEEYILFNERNEITECVNGNILLKIDNQWCTPKLNSGLLAGIMRNHYLKSGNIKEKTLFISDLKRAEDIAFINSVRKWITIEKDVFSSLKAMI